MNKKELHRLIDSLTQDIGFSYHGVQGSICPFSRNNISVCYGNKEKSFHSVDAAIDAPIINGESIGALVNDIEFE